MTPRRAALAVAAAAAALGLACLVYRGPAQATIRGHVGDLAATAFVVAALGMLPRAARLSLRPRVLAALALAAAIELAQALGFGARGAAGVLVGAHADPVDLVMYVVGALVAAAAEHALSPRSA